ncbi:MAG: AAA family ATPase [Xanthobacteraceae bacterium]|jgi:class 3 adenylate cyclase/tetratricopeptide (TPR) repeat protein
MSDISRIRAQESAERPIDGRGPAGERRQATVLFADLVGFAAFSERAGEEAAYALIRHMADLMTAEIHAQGGTVKSFTGNGIMALFGVPVGLEDAPLRACRAALAIQQRIGTHAGEIEAIHGLRAQLRIAINTGPMIIGEVESGDSTGVTAIGDTVNLAARLLEFAEPGVIVLTEATHSLVQGLVDIAATSDHDVKGKAGPQRVYHLGAVRRGAAPFDRSLSRGLTAHVGRARELAILERCREAAASRLQVIDVVGEPGIGKSRLVHEFRKAISGGSAYVAVGSCRPERQQSPLLPFIDILRRATGVREGESESDIVRKLAAGLKVQGLASDRNLGLLLHLLGLKPPDGALRGLDGMLVGLRTRDLLAEMLKVQCRLSPVILVIEDLHWLDRASEAVLRRLIVPDETLPVLMVLTRRPEYQPPWLDRPNVTSVELAPLPAQDIAHIARSRLGVTELPDGLVRLLVDKAEGNPLFAEEIASYLVERSMVRREADGIAYDEAAVAKALPGSILSLLTARVDRLPPGDRAMLQAASAVGRQFGHGLLAAVTGQDDIEARLAAIQALGLIRPVGRSGDFTFKHVLVQDVLYESLLRPSRSELHARIAAEIERRSRGRLPEVAETLAFHYAQTDQADKAFDYLVMAGRKSLGLYSLTEAARFFAQALALFDRHPQCADGAALIELLDSISRVFLMQANDAALVDLVDRYRAHIDLAPPTPGLVWLLANYSFASSNTFGLLPGLAAAEQALAAAVRLGDNRCKAFARVVAAYATVSLGRGEPDDIGRQLQLAALESDATDDAYLQMFVRYLGAWNGFSRGLIEPCRTFALELQERCRASPYPRAAAMGLNALGWRHLLDGRYDDALACGSECTRVAVAPLDREIGTALTGMAQIGLGRYREGAAVLHAFRQRAAERSHRTSTIDGMLGTAMVMQGDIAAGIRLLEQAIERADQTGDAAGRCLSRLHLAEVHIELLSRRGWPHLPTLARNFAVVVRVLLTGRNEAEKLLLDVRNSDMYPGICLHRARIEADLGLLHRLAGRSDEARACLLRARTMAEHIDARALLGKIDSALTGLEAGGAA